MPTIRVLLLLAAAVLPGRTAFAQPPVRRRAPTATELTSAYRDDGVRDFIERARAARFRVDSSLVSYAATSYERISANGIVASGGREKPLLQRESVGHVTWTRDAGAFVELTGQRRVQGTSLRVPNPVGDQLVPIPWYPGMDALWLPGPNGPTGRGGRSLEVDTTDLVNPLSIGSEAYYTFALGDSAMISLADGRRIRLRELRARPRAPRWNLSVGSYWFDTDRMQLVRAIYRLAVPYDVWFEAENARTPGTNGPPWYLKALVQPLKAELQVVTVEYGLHANQFWLPRVRRVDGTVRAGPATMGMSIEQGFQYADVNAVTAMPTVPDANLALRASADSLNATSQRLRDEQRLLRTAADSAAWRKQRQLLDSAVVVYNRRVAQQRQRDCATDGMRYGTSSRLGNLLQTRVAVTCDSAKLANSPELAGGLLGKRREVYASTLDDATRSALSLDEQAAFAPQRVTWHAGLEYVRYNRVEALSLGAALREQLGAGWSWEANLRGSFGDAQVNGELFATRSNGGGAITGAVYRRLTQADDYGAAFGPVASLRNFLSARDEQFYYRAAGADAVMVRNGRGAGAARSELRLFGEWQQGVSTSARVSLPWLLNRTSQSFDAGVIDTLAYQRGGVVGVAFRRVASRGNEDAGFRIGTATRLEAVTGAFSYLRGAVDVSVNRALPASLRASVTASIGSSVGAMPIHRWWNIGGWQTQRGQVAGAQRGDAFWMTRGEFVWNREGWIQPGVFADAGWAGDRRDLTAGQRVLTSAGGGVGLLRLPVRIDVARSLGPSGTWRMAVYGPIRF